MSGAALRPAAGRAVLGLDVQHVQEHVPVAEDRLVVEAREAGVIDLEQVKRSNDAEDTTGMADQSLTRLGQFELPLVMPPHLQRCQQEMDVSERHEILLVQDLVHGKEISLCVAGPVELPSRPMHEITLEAFGGRKANAAMFSDIGEGFEKASEQWRIAEGWLVISKGTEFNHLKSPAQTNECGQ